MFVGSGKARSWKGKISLGEFDKEEDENEFVDEEEEEEENEFVEDEEENEGEFDEEKKHKCLECPVRIHFRFSSDSRQIIVK